MPEIAQPVVEAAVAPNTPAQDVSSEESKPKKLSYNASNIPNPINNHEMFVHASLVEARLTRMALEKIAASLEDLIDAVRSNQPTTTAKK